jgi:N-acetylmuramoyl-L-alanine amidase
MPWNRPAGMVGPLPGAIILLVWIRFLAYPQTAPTPPPATTPPGAQEVHGTPPPPPQPPPVIMIDAAHGGTESGAVLAPGNLEKDVTLAFARRLQQDLMSRGLQAQLVRDGDTLLSTDQRASIANASRPSLYVCVHAASQGSGIRVYTAMLPVTGDNRGPFVSWQTAQAMPLSRSRSLQQQLAAAIQKTRFPVRSLTAPLRTLNSIVVPAVAIEIAPTTGQVAQLATSEYQQMISSVLANAIASIRSRLESGQ